MNFKIANFFIQISMKNVTKKINLSTTNSKNTLIMPKLEKVFYPEKYTLKCVFVLFLFSSSFEFASAFQLASKR